CKAMLWNEIYTMDSNPTVTQISNYINNPLWDELSDFIKETYLVLPQVEYSKCSMARGWNVKYKKGSRAICTLYPNTDYFTCLVVIGSKEDMEVRFMLSACDPYIQELYKATNPFNGGRWLMINVTSKKILDDVKELICIRNKLKK
ncbi:MAG: DUF3788 domain-containing protein, partial [Oscillospiraceae bacterium]